MEQRLEGGLGEIRELIAEHDQHPEAFEASLILAGLRWRDVEHDSPRRRSRAWQDVSAIIATLPWDAPLMRTRENWEWGDPNRDLLLGIFENTHNANIQRGNQTGAKKGDFLRVPRPWDPPKAATRLGGTAMPVAELDAWLNGDFEPIGSESHGGTRDL